MARIVKVKNTTGSSDTWVGQTIASGAYYQIDTSEIVSWSGDTKVFTDVGNGNLVVSKGAEDGSDDFSDSVKAWNWLVGYGNEPQNLDGRPVIHDTPRKLGTFTYFTGSGDSQTDENQIGGATDKSNMLIFYLSNGENTLTKYIKFNTINNETYLYEAIAQWEGCKNDTLTFELVPEVMVQDTHYDLNGTNTNVTIDGTTGLIVPTASGGTVQFLDPILVESPPNEFGVRATAYWDADYDPGTATWSNITANLTGTGRYNMFTVEFPLARFGNQIHLLGSGFVTLDSNDSSYFGHNNVVKVKFDKNIDAAEGGSTNRTCYANITLILHRNKTV
jgi:hypothetical protein